MQNQFLYTVDLNIVKTLILEDDEMVVSFDVTSLYTNVPVNEAIDICSDFFYSGKYQLPPVSKDTFKKLLRISTCDVLMLTHGGYYRQNDGLTMGSPPASTKWVTLKV